MAASGNHADVCHALFALGGWGKVEDDEEWAKEWELVVHAAVQVLSMYTVADGRDTVMVFLTCAPGALVDGLTMLDAEGYGDNMASAWFWFIDSQIGGRVLDEESLRKWQWMAELMHDMRRFLSMPAHTWRMRLFGQAPRQPWDDD